jgi:hypothetical protein
MADPRLRLRQQMANSRLRGETLCRTGRHAHRSSAALEFINVSSFVNIVRFFGSLAPPKFQNPTDLFPQIPCFLVNILLQFRTENLYTYRVKFSESV